MRETWNYLFFLLSYNQHFFTTIKLRCTNLVIIYSLINNCVRWVTFPVKLFRGVWVMQLYPLESDGERYHLLLETLAGRCGLLSIRKKSITGTEMLPNSQEWSPHSYCTVTDRPRRPFCVYTEDRSAFHLSSKPLYRAPPAPQPMYRKRRRRRRKRPSVSR